MHCGHKRSDVSYFRFPKDPQRLTAWLIRLKVKRNEINRQSRVIGRIAWRQVKEDIEA